MNKTPDQLCEEARTFTDRGEWQHSWYWPTKNGRFTASALPLALADLRCGDCMEYASEIKKAIEDIAARYFLAKEIEKAIAEEEEDESSYLQEV